MGKIISFANQKGGVGKTTTCINVASYIAIMGKKVLIVDMDPQGNATSGVGVEKGEDLRTVYDVIVGGCNVREAIHSTVIIGLDIIPSTVDLSGAEIELVGIPNREKIIKNHLQQLKSDYDFIMIDCPPSLGLITVNALTACDSIIIPIQCEFFALEGLSQLMNTIRLIKQHLNPNIDVEGVVLTMKDKRSNLINQVSQEIIKFFNKKVFETYIPRNITLAEAPSHGLPIALYDRTSRGSEAYLSLAEELLDRNKIKYTPLTKSTQIKLRNDGGDKK